MKEIIVTAGSGYIDIDVLSCGVAYTELLNLQNKNAALVLMGEMNATISKSMRNWNISFKTGLENNKEKEFVIVDVSNPKYFSDFVDHSKIIEVWDHRYGFEKNWLKKLGNASHIEAVGTCATLIWEEFEKQNLEHKISKLSANLLYTTIFAHTLNFQSFRSSIRDENAFKKLKNYINLPKNWLETYYDEIDAEIIKNPIDSMLNDTKEVKINKKMYSIGQLELWNANRLLEKKLL